ncbi:TetR/AcrR family transcriptional regulator [Paraburkholderia caballeronis]|uniref:DNA-binding transcriptional regulator, AcrR family n=1 Tax=Paraburkholderia caballeronis TaxID=416943 RepID=A0A1H7PXY7_9BURK|nr:TetR/AcrR family transcriptional regulator [Paraburkholderia caballeronis]PXW24390.1 TetR family transcriptional regulator [Paraburkholderia caballeronis]PXX00172.1 TetR family transcriptional regulator [Paraburkholderia caballeronis]RAJ97301.1 TetR family transcriptional regulator [Paraburkholderia caballeronis]TDV09867.1 TetR family transcriptional regulator [Paraburkholderia caballeronis]TDV14112.1 TetR family transcriptional regulator [Paraburkholderia caballeronis]
MRKGEQTRAAILDAALDLAGRDGLEGLTIGLLAERMQMSKSGVFAHFGSREDLQVEVVREYHRRFEEEVFFPSLREPRGLPRLRAMLSRWFEKRIHEVTTGCIYISGAVEYDDRADSQVREQLVASVTMWRAALLRAISQAIEEGHLRRDTDPALMLFELYSVTLGLHHDGRFLHLPDAVDHAWAALEKLIVSYQSDGR